MSRFQSPCGDYVSGKSLTSVDMLDLTGNRFQSPCGDYVSGKFPAFSGTDWTKSRFQSPCGDYVSGKLARIHQIL